MAKWPAFNRVKTRLSRDIGKQNSLKIQEMMFLHTISIARALEEKNVLDIYLAISGIGLKSCKRLCRNLGIKKFNLQGEGSLGEKMKRQLLITNKKNKDKRDLIIIGTDVPDLCEVDLLKAIHCIQYNDVILGPSNDGGYWLISFSKNLNNSNIFFPFININWSTSYVLQQTIDNLNSKKCKIEYLNTKVDIDVLSDIEKRI